MTKVQELADKIISGDRRALSRAITADDFIGKFLYLCHGYGRLSACFFTPD